MSQSTPRVIINRASEASFEGDGLRDNFVYRDLGIKQASGGKVGAHVIRVLYQR